MIRRVRSIVQSPRFPWIVYGLLLEVCFLFLVWVSSLSRPLFPFLGALVPAFGIYFVCVRRVLRPGLERPSVLSPILIFSALFHVTLLPTIPILDDDIYRYIWDGRVFAGGMNPYLYPPDSPEVAGFRDTDIYPRIGYKFIPTIYPPTAQVVFLLSRSLPFGEFLSLKVVLVLFNAASVAFLVLLLKSIGHSPARVAIFAWNPLVLKELVNSAHFDSIPIALFLGTMWLVVTGRKTLSALFYFLAVLAKFFPLIWLPFFWGGWTIRRVLPVGAIAVLAYLPFLWPDPAGPFTGLRYFSQYWEFNAGPFFIVQWVISFVSVNEGFYSKLLAGFVVVGFIIFRVRKNPPDGETLIRNCYLVLGLFLLLLPTVYPWYVCWMVPFLCLFPSPAWLGFTALVNLSYLFYLGEEPIREFQWLEYVVFFLLWIRFSWNPLKP